MEDEDGYGEEDEDGSEDLDDEAKKGGALKVLTAKLAAEAIDIKYIYGTTCSCGGPAKVVLSTSDNEKALVACKKK